MGNTVMDFIPEKLHFSMPSHAGLKITYGSKAVLFKGIRWNNCVFHIEPSFKALKFRSAKKSLILRLVGIWSPLSAIGASSSFSNKVRLYLGNLQSKGNRFYLKSYDPKL